MPFDGKTYSPVQDRARLTSQIEAVKSIMSDHGWWTLADLAKAVGAATGRHATEAGVSARIRDLRKDRFGAFTIERERVQGGDGLFAYRMARRDRSQRTLFD